MKVIKKKKRWWNINKLQYVRKLLYILSLHILIQKLLKSSGGVINNPYLRFKKIREIYHIEKNSGTNIFLNNLFIMKITNHSKV